jgi:hypothetical protein
MDILGNDAPPFYTVYFYDWEGTAERSFLDLDITYHGDGIWEAHFATIQADGGRFDEFSLFRGDPRFQAVCVDVANDTGTADGTPAHPFHTIGEAIDAASDGATVRVARGTYAEGLMVAGKRLTIKGGYVGGTYPGAGDFWEANRDPATNPSVINGGGSATQVICQDAAARGSSLDGLTFRNGGAIFRGGPVLRRVIAKGQ